MAAFRAIQAPSRFDKQFNIHSVVGVCVSFWFTVSSCKMYLLMEREWLQSEMFLDRPQSIQLQCAAKVLVRWTYDELPLCVTQSTHLTGNYQIYSGGPSKCFFELGRRMKFII
ncbi:Hypothetical_protein [Hexamita inflata]|uniref:Hypothetical_protein n=1 Tax=Hexamita inflata TaxID=28002 RepID=A0AA86QWB6_9EUKA|nr:Hypothetical protein HINF_LOCUS52978 [Hexamita inflata]